MSWIELLRIIVFSWMLNWCISLHRVNQATDEKKIKMISAGLALMSAGVAGALFIL